MLALDIAEFMIEVKDGAIKNVGPPTKSVEVKLYDVASATAREFGDERAKLVFADEEGNEVQVALFPDDLEALIAGAETLRAESPIFADDEEGHEVDGR